MAITYSRDIPDFKEKVEEYAPAPADTGPEIKTGTTGVIVCGENNVNDVNIVFSTPMTDDNYSVSLTLNNLAWGGKGISSNGNKWFGVTAKTASGFTVRTISFNSSWSVNFDYIAIHN